MKIHTTFELYKQIGQKFILSHILNDTNTTKILIMKFNYIKNSKHTMEPIKMKVREFNYNTTSW